MLKCLCANAIEAFQKNFGDGVDNLVHLSIFTLIEALKKQQNLLEPRHGLELWRELYREHEPRVKSRFGGMLTSLLQTKFKGAGESEFDSFEKKVKEYENQSRDTISDPVKQATVLNGLGNERLLEHLQLNAERFSTYHEMKSMITNYFQMRRTWSGSSPMDIGALGGGSYPGGGGPGGGKDWGGGKDRGPRVPPGGGKWDETKGGKGKGKEPGGGRGAAQPKSKAKGKGGAPGGKGTEENRSCRYKPCGKVGHLIRDCPMHKADVASGKATPLDKKGGGDAAGGGGARKSVDSLELQPIGARNEEERNGPAWMFSLESGYPPLPSPVPGPALERAATEGEVSQQMRSRRSGAGKKSTGVDTNNSMPVRRYVLPRKQSVGCFGVVVSLLLGILATAPASGKEFDGPLGGSEADYYANDCDYD